MPKGKKGKKGKKGAVAEVQLEATLAGTLDKYCGNGFKPRHFTLSRGLLKYYREEPSEGSPQEGIAITWIHGLADAIDHSGLVQDPKRELQFQHQDHVFRLRAETPELQQKWLAHLSQYVKNVSKSEYIYGSAVECVEEGGSTQAFAYLTDGALVLCVSPISIASLDFPKTDRPGAAPARPATQIAVGKKVRMAGKAKNWTVVKVVEQRAQIQMEGSAMKKWAEFDQLTELTEGDKAVSDGTEAPEGEAAEVQAATPKEYPMSHVTELQTGFDDAAAALSADASLEFQFLLFNKPSRFRVREVELQFKWMQTLEQEIAAASAMKDDAVTILHQLLSPQLVEAPVVDEDIHYILFFTSEGETEQDQLEKASFRVESTSRDAHLTAAYEDEFSPIGQWLSSLGIAKSQEYGKLMEVEHEMEMEDIPHLTEANLVDMGITAVGPRNRILREIAFMNNKNKDPTIGADGTSAVMQIQFYLPHSPLVVSEDIPLDMTVEDLKKKLIVAAIRQQNPKAKAPSAEELSAQEQAHQLMVVAQLGHWEEEVALVSGSPLREVPFIFYCFQNQKVPRLSLQAIQTATLKRGMLDIIVSSGLEWVASPSPRGGGEGGSSPSPRGAVGQFAHLSNSTQLKRLRKVMSGVRHLVDQDTTKSKKATLRRRTLLASTDMHVDLGERTEFEIRIFPVSASRFESHVMTCRVDMTVQNVIDSFISDYEGGRWGKVLNERKRAGACLKRFGLAEFLFDDDLVSDYNYVRHEVRAGEVPKFTLDFSPLFEDMRASALEPAAPVPKELQLLMSQLAWISPDYVPDVDRLAARDEDDGDTGDGGAGLAAEMHSTSAHLEELDRNPLCNLSKEEKALMWQHRREAAFRCKPRMLSKVVMSVPSWTDQSVVDEAYALIDPRNPERWAPLGPAEALQFLDPLFYEAVLLKEEGKKGAPPKKMKCKNPHKTFRPFREHAVRSLVPISDSMLVDYMPQLVQLMKNETLQDSALARYLMYRSLRNPYQIGQLMYWGLRAEMAACPPPGQHTHTEIDTDAVNRQFTLFGLFLRRYLDACGSHRQDLIKQEDLIQQLRKVGRHVKDSVEADRLSVLKSDLRQLTFPKGGVRLPVNSSFRVNGIMIDKCRYMDSAKKPLWITCKNTDPAGDPIMVIFKDGDDVRQDQLCLQMFKIMMELWEEVGITIPLVPYGCVTLAYEVGLLEVVPKTNTLSNITKDRAGAGGVWNNKILAEWLQSVRSTHFTPCIPSRRTLS